MPSLFRKMDTRHLHGTDMKQIVSILRNDPNSLVNPESVQYRTVTEAAIRSLPRRLRSTPLSSRGLLCRTHKRLDAHLIDDIWAWTKFELEVAVGRFLYPIIMSNILYEADEYRIRQLEPVVEMFLPEWTLAESAPPGKQPIDAGTKWAYQKDRCPACMLARIGSDESTLFALFAGMYGHLRLHSGGQKGVNKIQSKRLRFIRYWMRTYAKGDQAAQDAYDLGVELKTLRHESKSSLRRLGQSTKYTRYSLDEPPVNACHHLDDQPEATLDILDLYNPTCRTIGSPQDYNSKISPTPPFDPTTPTILNGSNHRPVDVCSQGSIHIQPQTPHSGESIKSVQSIYKTKNDTLAPVPPVCYDNPKRRDSVLSSSGTTIHPPRPAPSIYSYPCPSRLTLATSIASYNNPSKPSTCRGGYDPMETQAERLDKYRFIEFEGRVLPKPSRVSIYSAFGEQGRDGDKFEVVDVTPPPSPLLNEAREDGGEECNEKYDGHGYEGIALLPRMHGQ